MKQWAQKQQVLAKPSAVIAALVLFAISGCVRVPTENKGKIETRLITATAGGQTILCWDSRADLTYTILVAERFDAVQWQPLPNLSNLRGTGQRMEFKLQEDPNRPRCYKIFAR